MIQEASASRYKAVLCQRCREPIPVPAIVFSMAESAEQEKVFTLRCRACEAEKPYRSSQMVEVEGLPRSRRPFSATLSGRPAVRAAHA